MGIKDMLGQNGVFISDEAREHLNITLDKELFDAMKEHVAEGSEDSYKCFVTGQWCPKDKGVYVPPVLMVNALEKNLEKADELWSLYKNDGIMIDHDGKRVPADTMDKSDRKKYEKKIKLGFGKKLAMKQYIKMLKGKSTVPT